MVDNVKINLRLRIVYDTRSSEEIKNMPNNKVYVEYKPEDFEKVLLENSVYPEDTKIAFKKACKKLKQQILRL